MKIREIRCAGLRGATPEGGWSNELQPEDCVHTLIAVHTDEGAVGLGSVFTNDALVRAALAVLEPLYLGENALEPERVSEKLHQNTFWLGRGGSMTHAISGVDIALWDLLGQATGQPVGRLLGGRYRERVQPYASLLMDEPEKLGDHLLRVKAQGFRAFKIGWGPFGRRNAAGLRRFFQLHDEPQVHFRPHRGFAEDGADVEHAQAAHLEKIAQQRRAAPFERFRRDAIQLDDVVGDEPAAAADQFERQLAFPDAAVASEHDAHAEHVEKHPVHRRGIRERAREVGPQHPHEFDAVERRGKQRDVYGVGECAQVVGHALAAGDDEARQVRGCQPVQRLLACDGVEGVEMVDFQAREQLDPVGMDEVEVADQAAHPPYGTNLTYPLDWKLLTDYVGFPAFMKPFVGGGWKNVYKVHSIEELIWCFYNGQA